MNFIQLVLFFLALNLVPEDAKTFALQTGDDRYVVTRQADAKAGWTVVQEGQEDVGNTVSVKGTTMHVRYDGQVTINFMHQYVAATEDTDWAAVDTILVKAVRPASTITITRGEGVIDIAHSHELHGFDAHIAWESGKPAPPPK